MARGDGDFQQLKAYWYQKLKDAGFKDAESPRGHLKDWPAQRLKRDYTPEKFEEKQNYYRYAAQFLFEHDFPSPHERKVWELHSQGYSLREIVHRLRKPHGTINKDNVQKITSRYARFIRKAILDHAEE